MAKEITTRLTKNEIIAAYNEAAEQLKTARSQQTRQDKELADKKEVLRKSKENTYDEIIRNIAELKLAITSSLDNNEKALIKEFKRLEELSQAVKMEDDNLNELYQIHNEAGTLEALLVAQRIEKEKFEKEMTLKKAQFETEMNDIKAKWDRERSLLEQKLKEEQQQVNKDRKREEEEYNYDLKLKRKKETDAYEEKKQLLDKDLKDKKAAFEKEISEREAIVAEKEAEMVTLRKQVGQFPVDLEKAVKEVEKRISDQLGNQFKHEKELFVKENEGLMKLKDQIITSLQLKIKEQEQLIKELTVKSDKASQQVQDIALKALEGSASIRYALRENIQERKKEE